MPLPPTMHATLSCVLHFSIIRVLPRLWCVWLRYLSLLFLVSEHLFFFFLFFQPFDWFYDFVSRFHLGHIGLHVGNRKTIFYHLWTNVDSSSSRRLRLHKNVALKMKKKNVEMVIIKRLVVLLITQQNASELQCQTLQWKIVDHKRIFAPTFVIIKIDLKIQTSPRPQYTLYLTRLT